MTTLELIQKAEYLLNVWLVDNTEQVFEERAEIDDARTLLIKAIEQLQEA